MEDKVSINLNFFWNMARGRGFGGRGFGRGRGIGGRRGFGGRGFGRRGFGMRHRRGRFGRGRGRDPINEFEMRIDSIAANVVPPLLYNGMLTIAGRDTSAITYLDNFNLDTTQNYQVQDPVWNQNLLKLQEIEAFH